MIAAGTVAVLSNFGGIFSPNENMNIALAEDIPVSRGISDPSAVSDEQNSIEVYKTLAPGVAFITTTSTSENFLGQSEEG
ncbi:MAG TPA: hypothetical protein VGB68_00475, partial [Pyrinomonadaceae bacterium]